MIHCDHCGATREGVALSVKQFAEGGGPLCVFCGECHSDCFLSAPPCLVAQEPCYEGQLRGDA